MRNLCCSNRSWTSRCPRTRRRRSSPRIRSRRAARKRKSKSAPARRRPERNPGPGQPQERLCVQELPTRTQHLQVVRVEGIYLEGLVEFGMRLGRREVLGEKERHSLIAVAGHQVRGAEQGPSLRLEAGFLS